MQFHAKCRQLHSWFQDGTAWQNLNKDRYTSPARLFDIGYNCPTPQPHANDRNVGSRITEHSTFAVVFWQTAGSEWMCDADYTEDEWMVRCLATKRPMGYMVQENL